MKKVNFVIIALLIFSSCSERKHGEKKTGLISHFVSITDNEDKGVKEILDFYGGQCEYSIGASSSNVDGKNKYFELKMSKSEFLEQYKSVIEMPASNISYIFYKNLKEENDKYDFIKVVIEFADGGDMEFEFPRNELEIVRNKLEIMDKVSELMKGNSYNEIFELFDEKYTSDFSIQDIENLCEKYDSSYGEIDIVQFQGFTFTQIGNVEEIGALRLTGIQKREKKNTPLTIYIDPGKAISKRPLMSLSFEI